MINVYLDSNIYIQEKYGLNNSYFLLLNQLIQTHEIRLLYSNVTKGEVFYHLRESVESAVTAYNKAQSEFYKAYAHYGRFDYSKLKTETEISILENEFNKFWGQENSLELLFNNIDINNILLAHFNVEYPFEKKKRNEFKDAFMIEAIKLFIREHNEQVYLITKDNGVIQAVKDEPNIKVFESLEKFSSADEIKALYDNSYVELLNRYINREDIKKKFLRVLENSELIRIGEFDYEVESFDIDGLSIVVDFATCNNQDNIQANLMFIIDYSIEASYIDIENSIYDPEDKCFIYKKYIYLSEKHKKNISVDLDFILKHDGTFNIQNDIGSVKDLSVIELDDESLVDEPIIDMDEGLEYAEMLEDDYDYQDSFLENDDRIDQYSCENCSSPVDETTAKLALNKQERILCDACLSNYNSDDEL